MEFLTPGSAIRGEKKKVAIYGLDRFTEASLLFLAFHNIDVSAFFVDNNEIQCKEYLGKRVLTIDEINDEYSVYDLFGENILLLQERGIRAQKLLDCNVKKEAVIYGAGMYGKLCYEILRKYGCRVKAFCDQDKKKVRESIFDCKIISREELQDYKDCEIVIGLDTCQAKVLEEEFKTFYGAERIFYNNWSQYFVCGGNVIDPFTVFYLRHRADRITLIGYKRDIFALVKMMRYFDISIKRAVDHDGYTGEEDSVKFIDRYELAYEEDPAALYCIMENGKELAGQFMEELGFKKSQFVFHFKNTAGNFDAVLDVNMGHNKAESISVLKVGNGNDLKIGILGGSTSDIDLYGEKSWVEYLCDMLGEKGVNATFYVGAEKSYCSSQELVKLSRDMILYKPDIVISYSGVNDNPYTASRRNIFITNYQEELFHTFIRSSVKVDENRWVEGTKRALCYGTENSDYVGGWIRNERMMYGICREFGIRFYAILQPCIFNEKIYSSEDRELIEMNSYMYKKEETDEISHILQERYKRIREMNVPWLHDFSEIFEGYQGKKYFDRCHVFEEANAYIALKIFDLIEAGIVSAFESRERQEDGDRCIF